MHDRIPSPGKENRVRITLDNGQVIEGVLSYADEATQEGSAYTKGNVLPDDVCSILGLNSDTAEPKDAFTANKTHTDNLVSATRAEIISRFPSTFEKLMTGRVI